MVKLSDYVFSFIKSKGIRNIFMLPGGGAMHLVDSVGKSDLEYVCFQHEQAAAIAGLAYGQHKNEIGVVLVTSGPGATNAITGVTAGWIDSTPMLIISGQVKTADLIGDTGVRQNGSQEVQIVDIVKPITKYAVQIQEPQKIRYHLERAYHEAITGRPGPVWLDIPLDIQAKLVDEDSMQGFKPLSGEKEGDVDGCIDSVVRLLKEAKRPILLAGAGIRLGNALDLLYDLQRILEIPTLTTWMAMDYMGENDKLYIGHPGAMGDRGANFLLQNSDLLIVLGSRLDNSITAFDGANFGKNAKKIVIDIDECELRRMNLRNVENLCVCNVKTFLNKLLSVLGKKEKWYVKKWEGWIKECQKVRSKYPVITQEHKNVSGIVSTYYFVDTLCRWLLCDDVVVPESSGGAAEIVCQAFKVKYGQKVKIPAGLGAMGFGLPYAIGACLANDRRRTILVNGDGAFQLNIQELETLHRLQLPVKIFILNNNGYASIRFMQRNSFNGHYVASSEESGFSVPKISKIAEAYGIPTYQAHDNVEMEKILPGVLGADGPVLCELHTSCDEVVSPRTKTIKQEDGSMYSTPLEDMWPFLKTKE